MEYTIRKQPVYTIEAYPNVGKQIDEATFTKLKTKIEILRILRHAEYHYALIGQAYKNFEMSLFEVSFDIEHSNRSVRGIKWSGQQKIHINLMAALNTMHTYLNNLQTSYIKDLKKSTKEDLSEIENQLSISRNNRIEYRVMRALRNCITHAPYADIGGSINSKVENKTDTENSPWCRRCTSNPAIVIDLLIKNRSLEKKCKNDLTQMKQKGYDRFDVKFMLRGYIGEVAKIHDVFRKKTESLFNDILTDLREVKMNIFGGAEIPPEVGIKLIKSGTKTSDRETYNITYEFHSRLKDKRQGWKRIGGEQNRYYSSEIIFGINKYPQEDPKLWITD